MCRLFFKFVLFITLFTNIQCSYSKEDINKNKLSHTVIRAAIDIGSGATKLRIAEVDPLENRVKKILFDEAFTVPYQEDLEKSSNRCFGKNVMQTGLDAMKKCKEISLKYKASKIIGVATESFRYAANAKDFIKDIYDKTGIQVHVVDQDLEGKLAFKAVASQVETPATEIIVWDIGGGSLQLTSFSSSDQYMIYRGNYASIPFKNDVIKNLQGKDLSNVNTPNPMTSEEIFISRFKARKVAFNVGEDFVKKINQKSTRIIGVGSIFNYRILPLVKKRSPYYREELFHAVEKLKNLDDVDVGGGDFANVAVTNPILILGFMEMLDIEQMEILDVNNADGSFIYEDFWK